MLPPDLLHIRVEGRGGYAGVERLVEFLVTIGIFLTAFVWLFV